MSDGFGPNVRGFEGGSGGYAVVVGHATSLVAHGGLRCCRSLGASLEGRWSVLIVVAFRSDSVRLLLCWACCFCVM